MKKRLKLIALVSLLCGLAAAGFGAWSYFHSRTQSELSRSLQKQSYELEYQSDSVKGTPEENKLIDEAHRYESEAGEMLDSAKSSSQRAVVFGIVSIILILASVATMMAHLKRKDID